MSETKFANPNQRTEQWFAERVGCLTASRAAQAFARGKNGKWLKSRADMLDTILAERLTGVPETTFTSAAMQWGVDHEADARAAYEDKTGNLVTLTGFVKHPVIEWLGASPDGLVGEDGLVEFKCPSTVNHIKRIAGDFIPTEYLWQMRVQLLCTGRKWCDFCDWDGRLAAKHPNLVLFVKRYTPTEDELLETAKLCSDFIEEVQAQFKVLINAAGE